MLERLVNEVIERLENEGYVAEMVKVNKNGVDFTGITAGLKNQKIRPTVYINECMNADDIIENIISHINEGDIFNEKISDLENIEFIKKNIYIGVNKDHETDFCSRKVEGTDIIEFLFINIIEGATVKVNEGLLKTWKTTYDELREYAIQNTLMDIKFKGMNELMAEMLGQENIPFILDDEKMYILTTNKGTYGAGTILIKSYLDTICLTKHTHKLIILPSSIHEVIIVPVDENDEIEQFNEMVETVNNETVKDEEILSNKAIIYEMSKYTQI